MDKIKFFLKKHHLAFVLALLVGLIYLAPHLIGIFSLGDSYQEIPLMGTDNEDAYLFRMQEILDGHPLLGSPVFFEYKDNWPMMPPVGEMVYAVPALLLNISLVSVLTVSKFILPFVLFLLVYFLIHNLTKKFDSLSVKINAVAGALFVTLGYDLVDYYSLWLFLVGKKIPGSFLLWDRPVNPILGGIFLFSFLLCLWRIEKNKQYKKIFIVLASVFLSLMIGSYFFSWGMALSITGVLGFIYILQKRYKEILSLIFVIFITSILTSPFWYFSWRASQSPFYEESVLQSGIFYTHHPLINKILLATLIFYFILFSPLLIRKVVSVFKRSQAFSSQFSFARLENWQVFCLSFLIGGFIAFNQQIITGMTIWPFHFVQYSIPLSIVVVFVLLYKVIKEKWWNLWKLIIFLVIIFSLGFGVYTQVGAYKYNYNHFKDSQKYKIAFDWLNEKEKDSVVLVREPREGRYELNNFVLAFTHCNVYSSYWRYSLMPKSRIYHNLLVNLRLQGIDSENIDQYLEDNKGEVVGKLTSNWKEMYKVKQFSDFSVEKPEEKLKEFALDYKNFMKNDFDNELKKYRLDYIFSVGELNSEVISQLPSIKLEFESNNLYLYSL